MRRKLYLIAGLVLAITSIPTLAVAGSLPVWEVAGTALLGAGGVLFVVASRRDDVALGGRTVEWHRLVGVGDVFLGAGFPLTLVDPVIDGTGTNVDVAILVAGAVGGVVLVLIGIDVVRGGEYVSFGPGAEGDA